VSEGLSGSPEDIRRKLEEAEQLFEQLEKVELPDGVKDHAGKKWRLKLEGLAIKGADSTYDEDEQAYDETRVMSYDAALELLSDFEDAIIFANVASPLATAGDAVLAEIENAQKVLEGAYKLLSEIISMFKKGFSWDEVLKVLWGALTRFVVVWTASTMKKSTQMNLALARAWILKARAKAFPQANKGRRLRRKRSRFRLEPDPAPKPKRTWFGKRKKVKGKMVIPKAKEPRGPKPRVPRDEKPKA